MTNVHDCACAMLWLCVPRRFHGSALGGAGGAAAVEADEAAFTGLGIHVQSTTAYASTQLQSCRTAVLLVLLAGVRTLTARDARLRHSCLLHAVMPGCQRFPTTLQPGVCTCSSAHACHTCPTKLAPAAYRSARRGRLQWRCATDVCMYMYRRDPCR